MGVLHHHRRFRRQEIAPNDDESEQEAEEGGEPAADDDDNGDEEGDDSNPSVTNSIPIPINHLSTTTANQFDKDKGIGQEVMKKVPSKRNGRT